VSTSAALKRGFARSPSGLQRATRHAVIVPLRAYFRLVPGRFAKRTLWNGLASHLWWLESRTRATTFFGADLDVEATEIGGRYIAYFGIWEPNLTHWISRRLRPGDVFVDIGANVGYFSLLASKLVGESGRVVSIEAFPGIFTLLEGNVRRNAATNVRPINLAAWNRAERVRIFTRPEHPPGTTTLISAWADRWQLEPAGDVPAKPLSAILLEEEAKLARLVKVDVEGAEWHVLTGMGALLEHGREDLEVIVEVAPKLLEAEGVTSDVLLAFFAARGFHAYHVVNDYAAVAYFDGRHPVAPRRVESIPAGPAQTDMIFSRVDADSL
jgi:FkbM family methyltransferase